MANGISKETFIKETDANLKDEILFDMISNTFKAVTEGNKELKEEMQKLNTEVIAKCDSFVTKSSFKSRLKEVWGLGVVILVAIIGVMLK